MLDRAWDDEQLIESLGSARRLIGKVAAHRGERDENFVDVPAVVAGILLLRRHDADHGERYVVEIDELANGGPAGKELLFGIGTEERDAPFFGDVILIVEAAFADVEAANLGKLRSGSC